MAKILETKVFGKNHGSYESAKTPLEKLKHRLHVNEFNNVNIENASVMSALGDANRSGRKAYIAGYSDSIEYQEEERVFKGCAEYIGTGLSLLVEAIQKHKEDSK